ncbi:hypothetical protein B0H14DRAFT_2563017 [Mycena olivaceomarginata]|nr:hypothetical protein B0H14DRAFT_2563017 [Mycena olivaceomarginata]
MNDSVLRSTPGRDIRISFFVKEAHRAGTNRAEFSGTECGRFLPGFVYDSHHSERSKPWKVPTPSREIVVLPRSEALERPEFLRPATINLCTSAELQLAPYSVNVTLFPEPPNLIARYSQKHHSFPHNGVLPGGLSSLKGLTAAPTAFWCIFSPTFVYRRKRSQRGVQSHLFPDLGDRRAPTLDRVHRARYAAAQATLNARRIITVNHSSEHGRTGTSNEIWADGCDIELGAVQGVTHTETHTDTSMYFGCGDE